MKNILIALLLSTLSTFGATDGSEDVSSGTPFADGAGVGGAVFGAWALKTSIVNESENGFFSGSSTNNGAGGGAGIDSVFHVGGPFGPITNLAWGIYANNGQTAVAYRPFSGGPLGPNQAFEVQMDNGNIDTGGYVGFVLRNGNDTSNKNAGQRFEFLFAGGETTYKYIDSTGTHDTGRGFTSGGMGVRITVYESDRYELRVNVFGDFTTHLYAGILGGTSDAGIESFALYNQNAGSGASHDAFFNKLLVTTVPALGINAIQLPSATNAIVSLQTSTGASHELQTCDVLSNWAPLTNFTGSGGTVDINDWFGPTQPQRFYRLKISY